MMIESPERADGRFFSPAMWKSIMIFLIICRLINIVFLPVMDNSEARYAAIAGNMAENGEYFAPQFAYNGQNVVFDGKPPFFFQCCGLAAQLLGANEFSVRLPALLSAVFIALVLYFTVKRFRGKIVAENALLISMLCGGFYLYAGLCMTDLMLAAACFAAICSYLLFDQEEKSKRKKFWSVCVFASFGLGMIVKGPVALVFSGIPIFIYVAINRRWSDLKNHAWVIGIIVFLLITLPSYALMQRKNPDFLRYFFVDENFRRFIYHDYGDKFGSGREFFHGVSLCWFIAVNLPGLLLLPAAGIKNSFRKCFSGKTFKEPLDGMMLISILTAIIFWALTSRVLITYLLPTVPAAAAFIASQLSLWQLDERTVARVRKTAIVFAVISGLGILAFTFAGEYFSNALARSAYRRAEAELVNYPGSRIYIARRNPYSAEFYIKPKLAVHLKERFNVSLANSCNDIFLVSSDHWDDMAKAHSSRKELFTHGCWKAFAPVAPVEKALDNSSK